MGKEDTDDEFDEEGDEEENIVNKKAGASGEVQDILTGSQV